MATSGDVIPVSGQNGQIGTMSANKGLADYQKAYKALGLSTDEPITTPLPQGANAATTQDSGPLAAALNNGNPTNTPSLDLSDSNVLSGKGSPPGIIQPETLEKYSPTNLQQYSAPEVLGKALGGIGGFLKNQVYDPITSATSDFGSNTNLFGSHIPDVNEDGTTKLDQKGNPIEHQGLINQALGLVGNIAKGVLGPSLVGAAINPILNTIGGSDQDPNGLIHNIPGIGPLYQALGLNGGLYGTTPLSINQLQNTNNQIKSPMAYHTDPKTGQISVTQSPVNIGASISPANQINIKNLQDSISSENDLITSLAGAAAWDQTSAARLKTIQAQRDSDQKALDEALQSNAAASSQNMKLGDSKEGDQNNKGATTMAEAHNELTDYEYEIQKAVKAHDLARIAQLNSMAFDQLKAIEQVKPNGPQFDTFDQAIKDANGVLEMGGIQAFNQANITGTLQAIHALTTLTANARDFYIKQTHATPEQAQLLMNPPEKVDHQYLVTEQKDNNGNIISYSPAKNGTTGAITIPHAYDPEAESVNFGQGLENGSLFSKGTIIALQRANENQNAAAGQAITTASLSKAKGELQAAGKLAKDAFSGGLAENPPSEDEVSNFEQAEKDPNDPQSTNWITHMKNNYPKWYSEYKGGK